MVWIKNLTTSLVTVIAFFGWLQLVSAQTNGDKLNVLVHDFVLDTNESRTNNTIEISIPLGNSFKRFSDIRILDKVNFPNLNLIDLNNRNVSEVSDEIDIVVFGTYIIVNEYVRINSIIYNVNSGLYHRVNYSRGTLDGFDALVEEVADDIHENLVEISPLLQGSVKMIAVVSDYETVSGKYDNVKPIRVKAEELTQKIIQEVEYSGPANSELIPWRRIREYKDVSSAELVTKLRPDMYVRLTFVFDDQKIVSLKTDFSIIEKGRSQIQKRDFTLPELKNGYYTNIEFLDFAINELSSFLNRIITPTGQWDYISFPNTTSTAPEDANVLIYKAENFSARNDFYLSSYHYYKAMNQFPESVNPLDVRLQLGYNKIYLDRLNEANEEFDFVLSHSENNGYAYLGKSIIEYYKSNYEDAIEFLNRAVEHGVDNMYMIEALKGFFYFRLNDFEPALNAFNQALEIKPGKIKIRLVNSLSKANLKIHIGLCHLGLQQFNKAVDYYEKLKIEFPKNEEMPYYLSNAYSKRGIEEYFMENYKQAIDDFTNSRKYYPNNNINDYLRTALIFNKQFSEAETYIKGEIEAGMYDPRFIWMTHGMDIRMLLLDQQNQNPQEEPDEKIGDEAIKAFNLNLAYEDKNPLAYYYIGEINVLLGRFERSLQFMEKAFEYDQFEFEIQSGLMQAYLINEQYDACDKLYKRISKINRKANVTPRATALIDFFLVSAALAQDKKEKKALKELEGLIKDKVLIDQWNFKPYLSWLEKCDCSPEAKSTLENLAEKMIERSGD